MCTFVVTNPEVAILSLEVMDDGPAGQKELLAYSAVPVSCLRQGLRNCPLYSVKGQKDAESEEPITPTLLLRVFLEPLLG